jgi:hypothetical protein
MHLFIDFSLKEALSRRQVDSWQAACGVGRGIATATHVMPEFAAAKERSLL